jgi:TRAP-type mannitol/chloroaromatic compound transport system permease small subunit
MKQLPAKLVQRVDLISMWSGRILAYLIYAIIGVILWEVFFRYLLNRPTIWGMELATMIFGTYMLGGGAYASYRKAHVKTDVISHRWSKRTQAVANACTFLWTLIFLSVILWISTRYGLESVRNLERAQSVWAQPVYHWKMTLPLAVLLMTLQELSNFIRNVTLAITGKEL